MVVSLKKLKEEKIWRDWLSQLMLLRIRSKLYLNTLVRNPSMFRDMFFISKHTSFFKIPSSLFSTSPK